MVERCRIGRGLSLVAALLSWLSAAAFAQQPSTFSVTIGHPALCLSQIEPGTLYNYLRQHFGEPVRKEQGAYWFQVTAQLWEVPISEVFVTDRSSDHVFVGVVATVPPQALADAILRSSRTGVVFEKVWPDWEFSPLRAASGAQIMFQGQFGKLFCRMHDIEGLMLPRAPHLPPRLPTVLPPPSPAPLPLR